MRNGVLLTAAEDAGFVAIITLDRSISHQQNMRGRKISVIVLRSLDSDLETLAPLASLTMLQLERLEPGQIYSVENPSAG